jgi:hypothetical protein
MLYQRLSSDPKIFTAAGDDRCRVSAELPSVVFRVSFLFISAPAKRTARQWSHNIDTETIFG